MNPVVIATTAAISSTIALSDATYFEAPFRGIGMVDPAEA